MVLQAFDLKGSSFTIPMLSLRESDIRQISARLAEKVGQAPSFFRNAPLVLNLGTLPDPEQIDLTELLALVREQGFLPVGISNCTEEQQKQAESLQLPVLTARGSGRVQEEKIEAEEIPPEPEAEAKTDSPRLAVSSAATVISDPVRSGQRVAVQEGDLIILSSVGSGAEVTAVGNIHVYGTLRGRAFAGSNGDTEARIFCRQLRAELVAVAGIYLVNEQFPDSLRGKPVHIRLRAERIRISPL